MKQYFIRIEKWYYAKNQLEEAAIEMIQARFSHQLVDANSLKVFWLILDNELKKLNIHHHRAKQLSRFEGTSRFQQKIGRANIDDLIIIEAVEVKGMFLGN
ncbi:hypothetical protein [Runella salmonicolor]|uniref:Uncharacterized protein n=1 Tax=Runella salmonicolor TaxID=2950278 RepID=A0ABT1FRT4_9BACT|nr:hypothetical protein [Runella salmonicolor]MCP1384473.1 hypothetical protein [Runella salmonicolor]